jgi:hypothetical protein
VKAGKIERIPFFIFLTDKIFIAVSSKIYTLSRAMNSKIYFLPEE